MTRRLAVLAAAVMGLVACGSEDRSDTVLTVFAAASLTDSFEEIGETFESEREGVRVTYSFAGSSDLASQIRGGAPADVFASADEASMAKAVEAGLMSGAPRVFVTNMLTIAVPEGNPEGVGGLDDLTSDELDVVICAPQVPCGVAAAKVQEGAGVDIEPASEEQSVTDVLTKVAAGEADAGLVYVTDIARAAGVTAVDFPESAAAVNRYPIGVVGSSEQSELAREFVTHVLSRAGQAVLDEAGFGKP